MDKKAIVCVDGEIIILEMLKKQLSRYLTTNYRIELAESGKDALGIMNDLTKCSIEVPIVISDKVMHDMAGNEFLTEVHRLYPQTLKVFLTGRLDPASAEWCVDYAKLYRWIVKPWHEYDLWFTIREALKRYEQDQQIIRQQVEMQSLFKKLQTEVEQRKFLQRELENANSRMKKLIEKLPEKSNVSGKEIQAVSTFPEIIGRSDALNLSLYRIRQVASLDTTVLILGETGTGKEIVSRAIHKASQRKEKPLIKINCAALPAELIESELFGHEKGAFTGAIAKKIGRFELAHMGTIFLDEIGEMSVCLQAKLLRVIEYGEFERLGASKTIKVNVRIIAATNKNLEKEIAQGRFRKDLYYRLNVYPVTLPPLRQRKDDIPLLVDAFISRYTLKTGIYISKVPCRVLKALAAHDWPGNIRELENTIERAVILSNHGVLQVEIPKSLPKTESGIELLAEVEKEHIIKILKSTKGKIFGPDGAASKLGINPNTLRSKLNKLGISKYSIYCR